MSRLRRLVSVALCLAFVAVACSDSDDDTAGTDPTVSGSGAVTTPSEPAVEDSSTTQPPDAPSTEFQPIEGVPGVTDEEISFAVIGTKANNPLGTCILDCYVDGLEAYFAFRNDQGGLFGRDLVVGNVLDDELGNNQLRSIEVISSEEDFGVFSATLNPGGWGDLDAAGVPTFAWNIHATPFANRTSIFGHTASSCGDCTNRSVSYAALLSDATTVASIGYGISENSKVCAQSARNSVDKYEADTGVSIGYFNDTLQFGLPNGIGPEVTAMLDAGVDLISTCIDLNGMLTLAKELDRQGGDDVVLFHPNSYNQEFVRDADGLFDGDLINVAFVPFELRTGSELQDAYLDYMDQLGRSLSEHAMTAFINADQAYQAILAAGPVFDRQRVVEASNGFTAYSAEGLINPIDWTRQHVPPTEGDPAHDYANECVSWVRVVDGAFEPIGTVDAPWLCWDNANLDWAEPAPTTFE